ncbi:MAG: fluoride efflux transporter CrcB [Sphingomonas sp.]|nr:fluoride efflux transporter CrcB [Sphingomonas sp.]
MVNLFLVMAGGALGAGARYLVGLLFAGMSFPWGTLVVNLFGAVLMGMLAGVLARCVVGDPLRLMLGVGVLGGFTTFSAFSLELVVMLERGNWGVALGYALASVIGSVLALFAALAAVRALA